MKTVYKILMPVLLLAIFPVLFFLPLLHLNITSSLAGSLSQNLGIKEYSSVYDFVKMASGMNDTQSTLWKTIGKALSDKDGTLGSMLTSTKFLYAFAVFAALMLLLALAAAVLAIVLKKNLLPTCFTAGALVSAFAMNKSFDLFAKPFLNGEISISSLLNSSDSSGVLSSILGSLAKVESLELAVAYSLAVFLLLCALVLSAVVLIMRRSNPKAFR